MRHLRFSLAACVATIVFAGPLTADPAVSVTDPYARSSSVAAKSGAVFMVIQNQADVEDRLVAASAPIAERVELHTHIEDAAGVMRMIEVEDGFAVPAGGEHLLARGGDHVMLLGLTESLNDGASFPLTLVFEQAGEITVEVPVDLTRKPGHSGAHN